MTNKIPHNFKDLTGMTFGNLTVIRENGRDKNKGVIWECQCSCENKTIENIRSSYLIRGKTIGCKDCMKKHVAKLIGDAHKKYNKYNLSGEYGIGYVDDGREFYFDKEDFHLIEKHYWNIDPHGYTYTNNPDSKNGYLHQIILNIPKGFVADHINRNKLDNRKNNLRICKNGDNAKIQIYLKIINLG